MPKSATKKHKAPKAAAMTAASKKMNVEGARSTRKARTAVKSNIKRVTLPDDATNAQIEQFKQKLAKEGYDVVRQLRKSIFYKLKPSSWSSEMTKYKQPVTNDPFKFSAMRNALRNINGAPNRSAPRSGLRNRTNENEARSLQRRINETIAAKKAKEEAEQEEILRMLSGLGINESNVQFNKGLPGGVGGGKRRTRKSRRN